MSHTGTGGGAAPTGCYKCGRPGHWSRDCPSSNPNPNPNPNSTPTFSNSTKSFTNFSKSRVDPKLSASSSASASLSKPKKAPRTRPKLTPDLLLSDAGLGYVLKYFPRNFKCRGRGYEVNDLRNLLRMYAEWHSQFLPYFPFDQFIHKVEDAGSRRVKTCIAELKERVANGGDPTKLKERTTEDETMLNKEDVNVEEPTNHQEDSLFKGTDADEMQEDFFSEIYDKTVQQETSQTVRNNPPGPDMSPNNETTKHSEQSPDGGDRSSRVVQITEEQKALMEAKRLKALEKAAARSRLLKAS